MAQISNFGALTVFEHTDEDGDQVHAMKNPNTDLVTISSDRDDEPGAVSSLRTEERVKFAGFLLGGLSTDDVTRAVVAATKPQEA